jgi:hypothetical protein
VTAGQVTAPCPGRSGAAPAQAPGSGLGTPAWPAGWEGHGQALQPRPDDPGAAWPFPPRSCALCSRGPGDGGGVGRAGKSWHRLGAAPLPLPCVPQVGTAGRLWHWTHRVAGARVGTATQRGKGRRGRVVWGSRRSRSGGARTSSCRLLLLGLWLPGLERRPSLVVAEAEVT